MRGGRSLGPALSRSSVAVCRSCGCGAATVSARARHSGGCQARSPSSVGAEPVGGVAGGPVDEQLRPLCGVRREQAGEPPCDGVAAAAPELRLVAGVPVPEVQRQGGCPRLVEAAVEHRQQRPGKCVGRPRIVVAGAGQLGDQRPREPELDAGADAVTGALGGGAEPVGQPLAQPPLHAASRHEHQLGCERVLQRRRQQLAEGVGEQVGPRGAVEVEHHSATLCAGTDASGGAGGGSNSVSNPLSRCCSTQTVGWTLSYSKCAQPEGARHRPRTPRGRRRPWPRPRPRRSPRGCRGTCGSSTPAGPTARAAETNCEMLVALPPGSHQRSEIGHQSGAAGPTNHSTPAATMSRIIVERRDDPRPGLDRVGGALERLALDRLDPALGPLVLLGEERPTRPPSSAAPGPGRISAAMPDDQQRPADDLEADPLGRALHGSSLPEPGNKGLKVNRTVCEVGAALVAQVAVRLGDPGPLHRHPREAQGVVDVLLAARTGRRRRRS